MERRSFIIASCTLCGLALVPGLLNSCSKSSTTTKNVNFTLDLSSSTNSALQTVGGSVVSNDVIVIRTGTSSFVALSALCTHQGCTVGYNSSSKELVCPCHGGTFDTNGNVLGGPPPKALQKFTVTQSGNTLTIKS